MCNWISQRGIVVWNVSHVAQGEELVAWLEKDTLDDLLARVAAAHAGYTLGLLIEGLHSYLKCVLAPCTHRNAVSC